MMRMVLVLEAIVMVSAAFGVFAADEMKAPEGEWAVRLEPSPGNTVKRTTQAYDDLISIKDGKLSTMVNSKFGFEPVSCKAEKIEGKTRVTAELSDEKHGKSVYVLDFDGDNVSGTMKWEKTGEDGKPKAAAYSIKGEKKTE